MAVSFTRRARYFTFAGLASVVLGIGAQFAVAPAALSAQDPGQIPSPYTVAVNPGNVPATASDEGCNQPDMADKPADQDGWLFVASPANFTSFEAIFDTGTVTLANQTDTDATKYFTKDFDHLLVVTAPGTTLQAAYATLDAEKDFFTLSHTCAATETTETPSPTVSPTETPTESPSESPTATPTESPSESPTVLPTTEAPSESPSESPTVVPTTVVPTTPSNTPTAVVSATETSKPTPSVLPTKITRHETPSVSPSVKGVKVVRPRGQLTKTGTPAPVGLLLLLGVGLLVAGMLLTVAGEARPAGGPAGRHRR